MDRELYNAARSGDVSFLKTKELTESRNLLSQKTPTGSSILHIAAESDQLEFFQEAVRLCWPPSLVKQANSKGDTPLHFAVRAGSTEVVGFIIRHAKQLLSDIEEGHDVEGYKELLRMENLDGDNALHLVARCNRNSYVAKLLIEADPELSTVVNSKSQQSACFIALSKRNEYVADVLLSSTNPSCSLRGHINGMTALHAATLGFDRWDLKDLLRKVVEASPDMITQGDDIGWTPLHYAACYGFKDVVKFFLEKNKLAAYKLDLQDGLSALNIAAFLGEVNSMEALIEACPDCADLVDNRGRNALHAAVLGNEKDAVRFILRLPGTLFCEADQDGNTPLQLAVLLKNDHRLKKVFRKEVKSLIGNEQKPMRKASRNSLIDKELGYHMQDLPGITLFSEADQDGNTPHRDVRVFKKEVKSLCGNEEKPTRKASANSFIDKELGYHMQDLQQRKNPYIMKKEEMDKKKNHSSSSTKLNGGNEGDKEFGYLQFCATLIATVTFTAAFTLPGGFIQSGGRDEGMAVLISKSAFQAFIIFDVMAFFASFSIIVLLLLYTGAPDEDFYKDRTDSAAVIYLWISYFGMALAFCCGLYVVLGDSIGFSIGVLVMSLIGTLVALFGPFKFLRDLA